MTDSSPMYAHVRGPANTRASEYQDQEEAADVTNAVLDALAPRISPREVEDLASRLPGPLGRVSDRAAPQQAQRFGSAVA